jgi:formamidopyrimidine-DNA glycosylase
MPELPEVEAARRVTAALAVGRRIVGVWCADDPIVFGGVSRRRIVAALRGRRVLAVRRHGKHFWLELDRRPWLLVHFGMTGGVHVPQRPSLRLKSSHGAPAGWPPRFLKLKLTFDDGAELAIADGRRLGRIRLRHDPRAEPPLSGLGFDAFHELPSPAQFHELLTARNAPMKAVLLDQSFAAGVGNWIADEVLYQARIAPKRRASTLTRQESARLRSRLRAILATAIRAGSDGDRFPRTWLFHHRWDHDPLARTASGARLRWETVGGRTTAWAPSVQR